MVDAWLFDRPATSLLHGPRGGGKSYGRAFATHLDSQWHLNNGTRILGGSLAQSEQIYTALRDFNRRSVDANVFSAFTKREAVYCTGSEVAILAASPTSVRGPHVPSLCLDEVDEIDPDIRESAYGMSMAMNGLSGMVSMTSTWHRIGGPMAELMKRGREGAFPVWTFCLFEVMERCPDERSGPNLEACPECPLVKWCHEGIEQTGLPKCKRSSGHYAIDSAIQKVQALSPRVFESDYLCKRPQAAGVWFSRYDDPVHVTRSAEYDPTLPFHVAIDCGVHTGMVAFQLRRGGSHPRGSVFADYYSYDVGAERAAVEIIEIILRLTGVDMRQRPRAHRLSIDSAGGAKSPVGTTVIAEYQRAGLGGKAGVEFWPKYPGSVSNSLQLVESFIETADGNHWLTIHPRCQHLTDAFKSYTRKMVDNQWLDIPEDPQHPHEELIDSLRGGLHLEFPDGLRPEQKVARAHVSKVF